MRPTLEQLTLAAEWLDENEGGGEESAACAAVARWLREEAQARMVRGEARKAGVPVAALRKKMEAWS